MKLAVTFGLALLIAAASTYGESLPVHVFGCVVSLPNVTDVTVSAPNRVGFSFRDTETGKFVTMNIMEYVGDKAWNGPNSERTTIARTKLFGLDERVISVERPDRKPLVTEQITDKTTAVLFVPKIDIVKYMECDATMR